MSINLDLFPESIAETKAAEATDASKKTLAKSKQAYRTISEAADELGVATHVLRFWETKFRHISPLKRSGGHRYYRPEDIDVLKQIKSLLYDEGYTIKGVQAYLKRGGAGNNVETLGDGSVDVAFQRRTLAELDEIRQLLKNA